MHLLSHLFASDGFMPHGHCYLWKPGLVWLHVLSDSSIGVAYVAISATLVYLVHRARRDIPFHWMFLAFGVFIIACGGTHFMEVWTLWTPSYWLSGLVKALTAVASVGTALLLPPLVPRALGLLRAARASEARKQQVERANQELEELYETRRQFFANVSHELRTPLALVLGPAEKLLAEGSISAAQRHDLEVVSRNARTLLKHVNDLLDISKLEAGEMRVQHIQSDLARLVSLSAAHFDALAQERQIAFSVEAPESVPAQVDPEKIQRVLLNLLSNAFKFTPTGGTIRCTLDTGEQEVSSSPGPTGAGHSVPSARITVRDSGPGVPPGLWEVIFERFRQGEGGSTRRFGGTGLGLAIVKEFVELHGGTVIVGEAPEGGAAFTVTLPLTAPAGAEVEPPAPGSGASVDEGVHQAMEDLRSPVEATIPVGETGEPLVLVVEDNPAMNQFIVETLTTQYRVATALDGREGLNKALELRPDLILSDVMMPEMSGDQLLGEVRRRPDLDAVPFVVLTAKADDELRVKMLLEGAEDYLMKPFSAAELRTRVGNLVTMKRARDLLQQELASQLLNLEELAAEAAFRKRELQTALEAVQVARDQAERASHVKTNFLRMVSHELRTPLAALHLRLQLLQRSDHADLSPRQQESVRKMIAASRRLQELIDSLLEYTRIESGQLVTHIEAFDLAELVGRAVDELQLQAEQKQLELSIVSSRELPALSSDPRLVRLILVNLVGNAIKYTERGGVEISLGHADGAHRLVVKDTGPGIALDQHGIIFEPFEQLEPVRQKHTPGVGLGLTIVREIAEALGGWVELASREGEGSAFTVVLPPGRPRAGEASTGLTQGASATAEAQVDG